MKSSQQVDPVLASARLTSFAGLALLVGLFVEGLTLLSIRRFIFLHIVVGFFLIPLTLIKLGSVMFRFIAYYRGDPNFSKAGPPLPLLRIMGPVVVVATVTLFGSGIWLEIGGPYRFRGLASGLHKGSFVIWFGAMAVHVLGHLREIPKNALSDWLTLKGRAVRAFGTRHTPLRGAGARVGLVVGSLALGLAIVVLTSKGASSWARF